METVCQTYLNASDLYFQRDTHTVCVDEMTSIQALERIAPKKPVQAGTPERVEFEYLRHGTQCLTGSWDVVLGQMIEPTVSDTRTEPEFVLHISNTVSTDGSAKWVFVLDQLNTHKSESLVKYVASVEGIDEKTLGKKGKSGVLKSMATRQKFLSDPNHQVRFVFVPKHSSRLNQIEVIFGIIMRRILRRGSFKSTDELKGRLLNFIGYFNTTFAK
ncbi:MAG: transposase, partial [Planctomycetota bacterium]|nr:transposase [Planctomycetota bacterium]